MVLGSTMAVFATETDTTELPTESQDMVTGTGKFEGYVTLDVTKLVLPTSAVSDFAIDPQGLLHVANDTGYGTENGAVYFTNAGGGHSDTSDEITIKNKSSYAIDVTVGVSLQTSAGAALSQIKLVDKDSLATATDPSLYFGIIKGSDDPVAITADGQTISASAEAVPLVNDTDITAGYKLFAAQSDPGIEGVTQSPAGYYYYYDLTSDYAPGAEQTITFKMTGATNNVEGWKDVTENVAAKVTYTVKKHTDAYLSATSITSSSNVVTATLPEGVTIKSIKLTKKDGSTADWKSNGVATVSGSTITFKASAVTSNAGGSVAVTFSDGTVETLTLN
jgi:hypothetical protein